MLALITALRMYRKMLTAEPAQRTTIADAMRRDLIALTASPVGQQGVLRRLTVWFAVSAIRQYQRYSAGRNRCPHPAGENCSAVIATSYRHHGVAIGTAMLIMFSMAPRKEEYFAKPPCN